jgi:hypothetical protein
LTTLSFVRCASSNDRLWHKAAVPIFGTTFRCWGLSRPTTLTLACVLVTQDGHPTDIRASLRPALGASFQLLGLLTAYYAGKISAKLCIVLVQKLGQATMSLVGGP